MKELYIDLKNGYTQELKAAYENAVKNNNNTVFVHGREISKTYAEYLLDFENTFLKELRDDKVCNNNDESE